MQFAEKCLLVRHVGERLDGQAGIEAVVGEVVVEPVALFNSHCSAARSRSPPGPFRLGAGDGEAGDRSAALLRDPTGIGPIAAADVDDPGGGSGFERSKEEFEEAGEA